MARNSRRIAALVAVLLIAAGVATWAWPGTTSAKPPLGLFTSLPIYWSESASVSEALDGGGEPHWARTALEEEHRLVPLDTLDDESLRPLRRLIVAQPRPLAPAENVALDDWVRSGGRLLLFADPFLTEHSRFPLGDKRRPQDVVLLSPILTRWGLQLTFDEDQGDAERIVRDGAFELPERLGGRLHAVAPGAPARCKILAGGLVADCAIGSGRAVIVADAALLEADRDDDASLRALVDRAFAE